jgi:hypothetical protein
LHNLRAFIAKFPLILPATNLVTFLGSPILDVRDLLRLLTPKASALFCSAMTIVHAVMQVLESPEVRQSFVYEFALRLLPPALVEEEAKRSYIRYLLFLPIIPGDGRLHWLMVGRDGNNTLVPADGRTSPSVRPAKEFIVREKTISFGGTNFRFGSDRAGELYANSDLAGDPLRLFLSCFREVLAYPSHCPSQFTKQLNEAIGAPGLTLPVAIMLAIAQSKREGVGHVLSALGNAEMLTVFLRAQYASDIKELRDQNRIYRDNSIGMTATGVLLRTHGAVLVRDLTEVLLREAEAKPSAVLAIWFPILKWMPQMNRIVLREALIGARRKFPDKLSPMTAIGGMLMLRFVMADVGGKAPHLAKLMQSIMQLAIINPAVRQEYDQAIFQTVGDNMLQLTRLRGNSVPRTKVSPSDLAEVIAGALDDVIAQVAPPAKAGVHPIVFSLQQLIEVVFTGTDEDHRLKLQTGTLF